MSGWMMDLGHAARRLARSPGFTATALTILVLGIGANATAFGVVNALLFQAPPFAQPDRIVTVLQHGDGGAPTSTSFPAYLDIARHTDVFAAVAAHTTDEVYLDQGEALTPLLSEYATASYLDVIGLAPARGSWFRVEHDDPTGPPAAVVTWGMWTDRLASDPDIVGRVLRLNGAAVTVIGVGPSEFNGGTGPAAVDLWLSISALGPTGGRVGSLDRRQDHPMTVRARLLDGVSVDDAGAAMDRLAEQLARDYPEVNEGRGLAVIPAVGGQVPPAAEAQLVPAATLTMAVVILVLVIGTLNLSNLLLVRSAGRSGELATRLALGAGRARVIRTVTAEAMLLAIVGGIGGMGVAALVARLLRSQRFETALPVLIDLRLDARVMAFTALLSLAAGLVFGLLPAIRATRRAVSQTVKDGRSTGLGGRRRFGLTGLLVTGQIAVSLLLLAISAVFVESLLQAAGSDPGFAWEDRIYLEVSIAPLDLDSEAAVLTYDALEARLEQLPGIGAVTRAVRLPGALFGTTTLLLGGAVDGVDQPSEIPWNYVSSDYFDVMEVPLLHGRVPERGERAPGTVALVTESMARTYWGREDVVGETYRSESQPDEPREIVGVVGDATVRVLGETPVPSLYWPGDVGIARMNFVMKVEGSESEALSAARAAVRSVDDRIMIFGAGTMEDHVGSTLTRQRLAGGLLAGLGVLALLLAMLGVYGVVSYGVSQRRREVGIRMALGAAGGSVVRYFIRDTAVVVVVGGLLGLLFALPIGRTVGQVFTGTAPNPAITGALALILFGTSLLATVIPASRAARTDPADALRPD